MFGGMKSPAVRRDAQRGYSEGCPKYRRQINYAASIQFRSVARLAPCCFAIAAAPDASCAYVLPVARPLPAPDAISEPGIVLRSDSESIQPGFSPLSGAALLPLGWRCFPCPEQPTTFLPPRGERGDQLAVRWRARPPGKGDPHYAGRARCRNGETCPHSRGPGRRIRCRRIFRTGGGEPGRGLRQIIQLRESGRIAGLLHDLGKYSEACQHYIASAGAARGPDHSTAGAREVLKVAS